MSEASTREEREAVEEFTQALGDDVPPESHAWWQYFFVVAALGQPGARQLVREVHAVEAAGGMITQDGSRRRTPGGVFFVLAYERLGTKRARSVRWRATRRVQEAMLQPFLRLLASLLPASPESPAAAAEPAAPAATPPAREPAGKASTAKPAGRREPEEVEVLVVRRRPAEGAAPAAKPGSSTPGAGR